MTADDIACYRANYDKATWEKITEGWTVANVWPGAILAINALCDEVDRLQSKLNAQSQIDFLSQALNEGDGIYRP